MQLAHGSTARREPLSLDAAYRAADYERCLVLLNSIPVTIEGEIIRARIQLRSKDYAGACQTLEALGSKAPTSTRDALFARVYAGMRDLDRADSYVRSALTTATGLQDRAEAEYVTALLLWMRGDHEQSRMLTTRLCGTLSPVRAEAYGLLGWNLAAREDFTGAIVAFRASHDAAGSDTYQRAQVLWPLAVMAKERVDQELAGFVARSAARMEWTLSTTLHRFHVVRCMAWFDAFAGDMRATRNGMRHAATIAPSDEWRVLVVAERAYVTMIAGRLEVGLSDLDEACELADACDWHRTKGEERLALLTLSQLLAAREPIRAARYLKLYDALGAADVLAAFAHDVRTVALEHFTRAAIAHGMKDNAFAAQHYTEAHRLWRGIEYRWRAIMAALGRFELGGSQRDGLREYIIFTMRQFPESWMRRHVEERVRCAAHPDKEKFTPRQLDVLRSLCAGAKTNAEIADEIGMSATSVRDHLSEIRRRIGARNRAQVIAWCVRVGLLA